MRCEFRHLSRRLPRLLGRSNLALCASAPRSVQVFGTSRPSNPGAQLRSVSARCVAHSDLGECSGMSPQMAIEDGEGCEFARSESGAKHSARSGVEALRNRTAVLSDRDSVHEDMGDAYRRVCGQSLAVGREVVDPAQGSR